MKEQIKDNHIKKSFNKRIFFSSARVLLIFATILITTSCITKSTIEPEIPSITTSDTAPDNPAEWHGSADQLFLGQDLGFENLSLDDGLSQSSVFSIVQDNEG